MLNLENFKKAALKRLDAYHSAETKEERIKKRTELREYLFTLANTAVVNSGNTCPLVSLNMVMNEVTEKRFKAQDRRDNLVEHIDWWYRVANGEQIVGGNFED